MSKETIVKEFYEVSRGDFTVRVIDTEADLKNGIYELDKIKAVVKADFNSNLPIAFDAVIVSSEKSPSNIFGVQFSVESDKMPEGYKQVESFNLQ